MPGSESELPWNSSHTADPSLSVVHKTNADEEICLSSGTLRDFV